MNFFQDILDIQVKSKWHKSLLNTFNNQQIKAIIAPETGFNYPLAHNYYG
ncbi:hypothetical protein HMPREF1565_0352 [Providencia alcalifaciens RIMD 1656011]|uniref:Uncharacterized protein n=1 Tax=Providencia alcalifaciens DSM 30120 TaxID=520999 RepID=B6XJN9_9GAMM|nr:hypothetical protein PROVALCAL_03597 [Providencia alcalifaciens DSM 30120]EUD04664.1 hypothetical protein HMPREF1565_0352 [Providencia alcalifaciens RIMD 1656011]EUD07013.1 hypothetical protein HMPREF1564_0473 [Providencia alcalifaciens R90-1475]